MPRSVTPAPASAGLATKGSQRQLQLHVNVPELRGDLESRLVEAAPSIEVGSLRWKSPLLRDAYREYFDSAFVSALGRPDLADTLKQFWPRRGPVWDGLATFKTSNGELGALLVEAKAHSGEVLRGGSLATTVSAASRDTIEQRLDETRSRLGASADAQAWVVDNYQYANRLAHALWLRDHVSSVLLAHVLFHDDPTHISEPETQLVDAAAKVATQLGFTSGDPDFALTISCPGAEPLLLAPADLPQWVTRPVALDGLQLEPGAYPPDPADQTRHEEPRWALVGEAGRDNDEVAVAAFSSWLEISALTGSWKGQTLTRAAVPLQRVSWKEFPPDPVSALAAVGQLARAARMRRRYSYRRCAECKALVAPEHRDRVDGRYLCHGCQEGSHGVTH